MAGAHGGGRLCGDRGRARAGDDEQRASSPSTARRSRGRTSSGPTKWRGRRRSRRTASCCTRSRRSTRSIENRGIRDPVGMIGTRLETGDVPGHDRRLAGDESAEGGRARRVRVQRAGARAAGERAGVLTDDEKELGVALVELGAGIDGPRDLSRGEDPPSRRRSPIGGNNVTNDIVLGLR